MTTSPRPPIPTRTSEVRRRACLANRTDAARRMLVLAVESDRRLARELRVGLANRDRELMTCPDPAEALLLLGRLCPDAVLLGQSHGSIDAIEFLLVARQHEPLVPIAIGADSPSSDFASRAAAAGASAVVARPYDPQEILAVFTTAAIRPEPIDLGRLYLDASTPRIWLDGIEITLPPREFLVLRHLAQHTDRAVTRDELLDAAWSRHAPAASNTLTVHIARLRRRLGDDTDGEPRWITAIRGSGYRLRIPPRTSTRSPSIHHAQR